MINQATKVRRLNAEATASLRLLKRSGALLEAQLARTVHPIIAIGKVREILTTAEAMDSAARSLCDKVGISTDGDDTVVKQVLTSPEGEASAKEFFRLYKAMGGLVESWDDGRSLARQQIEKAEPTPLVLRERTMIHHFTSLCRQLEAHCDSLWGLLMGHYMQFWVWDNQLQFAGKDEKPGKGG